MQHQPIPHNEMERVLELSDYDLDYTSFQDSFKDLAKLAAKVAGTNISLVNLIDSFTQWSITNHGLDVSQMPREESICQYTIMGDNPFEVTDLRADDRFSDRGYVTGAPNVKYYFGVPLTTEEGTNIGALCVLDQDVKTLSPEKVELLKIIAGEIVNRLRAHKIINGLKSKLKEATRIPVMQSILTLHTIRQTQPASLQAAGQRIMILTDSPSLECDCWSHYKRKQKLQPSTTT
ncbi:MAG: GAF domain-containing protein [Pedobacter sp.]|nr:MAG: GAF domain-containing protein [Pedobacter sp.]